MNGGGYQQRTCARITMRNAALPNIGLSNNGVEKSCYLCDTLKNERAAEKTHRGRVILRTDPE